jgi:hypothetical protein
MPLDSMIISERDGINNFYTLEDLKVCLIPNRDYEYIGLTQNYKYTVNVEIILL